MAEAGDVNAQNGRTSQVKEEEEETEKQPAAKRRKGQSKKQSQTKTEEMPKEVKSEGKVDQIFMFYMLLCRAIRH